jgi:hypothetical protein
VTLGTDGSVTLRDAGDYSFRAVVFDVAGNSAATPAISVGYDPIAPTAGSVTLTVTELSSGLSTTDRISNEPSFTLTLAGGIDDRGLQSQVLQAQEGTAGPWVDVTAAGGFVTGFAGDGLLNGTNGGQVTLTVGNEGLYSFRLLAKDVAGNTHEGVPVSMRYDNTPPTTQFVGLVSFEDHGQSTTDRITYDNSFTLSLPTLVDQGGSGYAPSLTQWQVDAPGTGGGWLAASSYADVTLGTDGSVTLRDAGDYSFRAVVFDVAGNSAATPAISVGYDPIAPTAGSVTFVGRVEPTDSSFSLSVGPIEGNSTILFEVDPPGNQSLTSFYAVGPDYSFSGPGSLTIGSLGQVTLGSTGVWVFRAIVSDIAGNTAFAGGSGGDLGVSMVFVLSTNDVAELTDYSPLYMKEESSSTSGAGGFPRTISDKGFSFPSYAESTGLEIDPSDAKASELGAALSSYLDSRSSVQTSVEPLRVATSSRMLESVPALANALSDYQIANIGLVKSDQTADLLRKVKEASETYPKPILAPPNGSS